MQLTIKTLTQETFKVELDPSATVLQLKETLKELKNYDVASQKLIFAGKILSDENTIESYNITETGFIVAMVIQQKSQPTPVEPSEPAKPSAPDPKPAEKQEPAVASELPQPPASTPAAASATSPSSTTPAVPSDQNQSTTDAAAAIFNESTFLTGSALEETINNIKAMGFTEEMIRKALALSYNNPDRAVELLVTNDPSLSQPNPRLAPAADEQERPREPTPGIALSGESSDRDIPEGDNTADMDADPNSFEVLSHSPQFQQIRNLIQSNPAFLEPLLVQLQNTNPTLFEQINQNREEFFRLMTASGQESESAEHGATEMGGGAGATTTPAANEPRVVTISLTPEEQAHVETIMSFSGVTRQQAVEIFLLCDKNADLAINYIFDNQNDL